MKNCIITPTKYINHKEIWRRSDFLLVLSHLLDPDCTNDYAKEVKKFKTETWRAIYLDNGLFENHIPERWESLLRKGMLLWADYIFAPDVLYDREATEREFEKFNELKKSYETDIKLAYVVQASDPIEYLVSYKWAEENPDITMIWLSILTLPYCFEWLDHSRDAFAEISKARMKWIQALDIVINPKKKAHLLWLWDDPVMELQAARIAHRFIETNDSCSAYMTWKKGFIYSKKWIPGWKIIEKVDFNNQESLNLDQIRNIARNIDLLKNEI